MHRMQYLRSVSPRAPTWRALAFAGLVLLLAVSTAVGQQLPPKYEIQKDISLYGNFNQNLLGLPWGGVACAPTAAVNSFVYLQNKYPTVYDNLLVPGGNGAAVVSLLGGQQYMNTIANNGTYGDDFIYGKWRYLEQVAPGKTVYEAQYAGNWVNPLTRVPPVPNPGKPAWAQTNKLPTWDFLYNELVACEDVEIFVEYEQTSGGHALTLTSFFWTDGNFNGVIDRGEGKIDYMDPWTGAQGVSDLWQAAANGQLETNYGGGAWIYLAVSESPVPLPAMVWPGLAILASFVVVRRRNHRG